MTAVLCIFPVSAVQKNIEIDQDLTDLQSEKVHTLLHFMNDGKNVGFNFPGKVRT